MNRAHPLQRSDRGSMTIVGAALILLAAVLLCAIAAIGHLLLCRSRARTAAEGAAIAVATAWDEGRADPCSAAADALEPYGDVALTACDVAASGDATVTVSARTGIPFVPEVLGKSRAGPQNCA